VNLAFYGHSHVYQRQSAVYKKEVVQASTPLTDLNGNVFHTFENPQATVHMVVGTGGAGLICVYYHLLHEGLPALL
jgi:hypothetical protein